VFTWTDGASMQGHHQHLRLDHGGERVRVRAVDVTHAAIFVARSIPPEWLAMSFDLFVTSFNCCCCAHLILSTGARHDRYSVPSKLSSAQRAAAFARVAEKRHVTSSGFWGQAGLDKAVKPVKRDLPAFWSLGVHGQPFNDERLTDGASNHFKVVEHPKLGACVSKPAGPATESLATLKCSLQNGFALFNNDANLSPLSMKPGTISQLRKYVPMVSSCELMPTLDA